MISVCIICYIVFQDYVVLQVIVLQVILKKTLLYHLTRLVQLYYLDIFLVSTEVGTNVVEYIVQKIKN